MSIRPLRRLFALALGFAIVLGVATPALASSGVLTGPADYSTYQLGDPVDWAGTVTLDADSALVEVYLYDSGFTQQGYWSETLTTSGDISGIFYPPASGQYQILLRVDGFGYDAREISVTEPPPPPPPLSVSITSLSPSPFYPLVRDGHKDATTLKWTQSDQARVSIKVHHRGMTVRRDALGMMHAGRHTWKWNGRKNNGTRVDPGKYNVTVKVSSSEVRSDSMAVLVKTAWVTKRYHLHKDGAQSSSRSTSGPCFIHRDGRRLVIDCWGGSGSGTWKLSVPSDAFNISRTIAKHPASDDICCDGVIASGWTGNRAWVKVTSWRAAIVS
jgi:hypothetical protein